VCRTDRRTDRQTDRRTDGIARAVKTETRHLVEVSVGNEFPSIYILRSYGSLKSKGSKKTSIFDVFFWKSDPLRGNFRNSVQKRFIVTSIDMLCSNVVKFGRREIGEVLRCLPDKKTKFRLALQLSLLRGSRPKSVRRKSVFRELRVEGIAVSKHMSQHGTNSIIDTAARQWCTYLNKFVRASRNTSSVH